MNTSTEHIVPVPLPMQGKGTPRDWLDALSTGACDHGAFFRAVKDFCRADPEASWEILSQLDQYYRRGKINTTMYKSIVSRIQSLALGTDTGVENSVPLPRAAVSTLRTGCTTPVGAVAATVPERQAPERIDPAVGDMLRGRYRLERVLGRGGRATVFEAIDQFRTDLPINQQRVAIKVLHSLVSGQRDLLTELRREFQNLQSLTHPNIVRVHEFDRDGDTRFFTMELLSGSLLGEVLERMNGSALGRSGALAIIRAVGEALVHAHSRGVVHGDISPRNIFITKDGDVRVMDFGASHTFTPGQWIAHFDAARSPVATPCFASGQLLMGESPDTRDDVYAVACVAYLLIAGRHPYQNRTAVEARTLGLSLRRPTGLSHRQWQALRSGLHFERKRRPSDIKTWLDRLVQSQLSRRSLLAWYGLAAFSLLAMGGIAWTTDRERVDDYLNRLRVQVSLAAHNMRSAVIQEPHDVANSTGQIPLQATQGAAAPPKDSAAVPPREDFGAVPGLAPSSPSLSRPVANVAPGPTGNWRESRIELTADTLEVAPSESVAHLTVLRRGNLRSDVTFMWWTESGTAKAGADFESIGSHVEHMDVGKDRVNLFIPLIADSTRRAAKNFYVVIDQAGPGASLGARTLEMVSILAPEGILAPE